MSISFKHISQFFSYTYDESANIFDFSARNASEFKFKTLKNPFQPEPFAFEKSINYDNAYKFLADNWIYTIILASLYVFLVFAGKNYMKKKSRPKMTTILKKPLICWDIFLAVFSIFGSVRTYQVFLNLFKNQGLFNLICTNETLSNPILNFWYLMFAWSKAIELIDTAFIILRKQKLIFLHWYHHAVTMIIVWYGLGNRYAGLQLSSTINFSVHSIMYSYYGLKALHINLPKFINIIITLSQIIQMLVGILIQLYVYKNRHNSKCSVNFYQFRSTTLVYFSYLVLFGNFFMQSYVFRKRVDRGIKRVKKVE